MRKQQNFGIILSGQQKCRTVKIKKLADALLGRNDFVAYPVGGKIDERSRYLGQQPFERQQILRFIMRFDSHMSLPVKGKT